MTTSPLFRSHLTLGTRSSKLALQQTQQVETLLRAAWPALDISTTVFQTSGDNRLDIPFTVLADNAFTDEIERALLAGTIDVAVHSYKDLPPNGTPGLTIAAIPVRADPRDALVARDGLTLATLPPGAAIGTSSERRASALHAVRPDLELRPIRGPVDSRLQQLLDGAYDAVIFAVAGLERLGLAHHITEYLDESIMPPAAGQGALAVQCRSDDTEVIAILRAIDNPTIHAAVLAEREAENNAAPLQSGGLS